MGILYIAKFPNGKSYIGITRGTLRRRQILHVHHARKGRNTAMARAIRKYGEDRMDIRVLVIADDWRYLCNLERSAIEAFKTMTPFGYNLTSGGEGAPGTIRTPEFRRRMSEARKGQGLGNKRALGYRHTAEAKAKISAALAKRRLSSESKAKIGRSKIGNKYAVGRIYTQEQRDKIAESNRATWAKNHANIAT